MPAHTLTLDFETRSPVELGDKKGGGAKKGCGLHVYAAHPGTSILCLAWAVDDEPPRLRRTRSV